MKKTFKNFKQKIYKALDKGEEPFYHVLKTTDFRDKKKDSEEPFYHVLKTTDFRDKKSLKESIDYDDDEDIHENKITDKQHRRTVTTYTEGSKSINSFLHANHRKETPKFSYGASFTPIQKVNHKKFIEKMDEVFANKDHYVGKRHVVYSGVPESPHRLFLAEKKRTDSSSIPDHVHAHLPAFTSTSTYHKVAEQFASEDHDFKSQDIHKNTTHVLKIHVPEDHPSISIAKQSKFKEEKEVLLHRGTRLKIHSKPEIKNYNSSDNVAYWHAEVVGHHLDELE